MIGVLYWTGLHLKTVIYLKTLRSDQDVSRVYKNQIQQNEVKGTAWKGTRTLHVDEPLG